MSLFLTPVEMRELTGFALKTKQIEQLRRMGIPFFVNGRGKPLVVLAAIDGRKKEAPPAPAWQPAVLSKVASMNNDHATGNAAQSTKEKKVKRKATHRTPRP